MKVRKTKGGSKNDQGTPGGGWEIVYSGFVLILLCFFIMLSSFSSIKQAKIMRFVQSFVDSLSILPGGVGADDGATVLPDSARMVDIDSPMAKIHENLKALAEGSQHDEVAVSYLPKGLVMRLPDHTLFDIGEAAVSPQGIPLLNKIGSIIAESNRHVRIEGHTDDVPIHTARYPSNWELSTARAVNVLRYFIQTYRIPREQLSAEGFSRFRPVVPNDSPANRARNRRVEIVFFNPDPAGRPAEGRP